MISFLSYKQKKVFDEDKNLLGDIVGVIFNVNLEKITGFIYKKSLLKHDFFFVKDIVSNGDEFLLIKNKKNDVRLEDCYDLIGKEVRNKSGMVLGNVNDIEFDLMFNLKSLIVGCGYSVLSLKRIVSKGKVYAKKNFIKVSKKAILSYEKDFILIDDSTLLKENRKTLEKFSEVFINVPSLSYSIKKAKYELFK